MSIKINHIIKQTKVEGPGNRFCIFVQGCLKHCIGCNSSFTWNLNNGDEYSICKLYDMILKTNDIKGVTFSGGEPFLQSKELYKLGMLIKKHDLTLVVFTGYSYNLIKNVNCANWNNLLSITDLLISGEYLEEKKVNDKIWVGSSNQEYHFLSNSYKHLENKLNLLDNKIEIHLNKDGSIVVNGMGNTKRINELFKDFNK